MTDYEKQANDFLKSIGATIECRFVGNMKHFPDDKVKRDVWLVIFTRTDGYFDVRFGQSIANTGVKPTAYDVLTCLTKDNPGTFDEFCSEYGYNGDSTRDKDVYEGVMFEWWGDKMHMGVREFFKADELDKLREIQ